MNHKYWSYNKSKKFLQDLGVKTTREFRKLRREGTIPDSIPSNPEYAYGKKWKGFDIFLKNKPKPEFTNFKEAKKTVQGLNIKSKVEFHKLKKQRDPRLLNIPASPDKIYSREIK